MQKCKIPQKIAVIRGYLLPLTKFFVNEQYQKWQKGIEGSKG